MYPEDGSTVWVVQDATCIHVCREWWAFLWVQAHRIPGAQMTSGRIYQTNKVTGCRSIQCLVFSVSKATSNEHILKINNSTHHNKTDNSAGPNMYNLKLPYFNSLKKTIFCQDSEPNRKPKAHRSSYKTAPFICKH